MNFSSNTGRPLISVGTWEKVVTYARMVKLSHTVFALPFALCAAVLAQRTRPLTLWDIFWLLLAMVGARSAAMGVNRIVDAAIDAQNPRTATREIPAGRLTPQSATGFVLFFSGLFILSAAMLGKLCLYLSVPILIILFSYSYTKRFTVLCHLYLGSVISLAPLGAWIALTGSFAWPITLFSAALMTYIAGFDILYACQDVAFDRQKGLFSIPARFGVPIALKIAALLHVFAFAFFVSIHFAFDMGNIYLGTAGAIGILMIAEHRLVKPDDLSRVNIAFFHINSVISLSLFAGVLLDEVARKFM
ncbi:MAG: UbiA-like polyprenyltransferase [Pseudomonadota bacterium]